jgi:hypothetical protein
MIRGVSKNFERLVEREGSDTGERDYRVRQMTSQLQGKGDLPAAAEYNQLLLPHLLRGGQSIDEARHVEFGVFRFLVCSNFNRWQSSLLFEG